jgi:hypothetical protein
MGDVVAFPVRHRDVNVKRQEIVAMIHYHTALACKGACAYHKAMAAHLCEALREFDQSGLLRSLNSGRV